MEKSGRKKSIRRRGRRKGTETSMLTMLGWGGQCQECLWGIVMRGKRLGYRDG